jgi:hypothetical protein
MKATHAAEIRKGIEAAKQWRHARGLILLNAQHYSKLAVYAFNTYRLRHWRDYIG